MTDVLVLPGARHSGEDNEQSTGELPPWPVAHFDGETIVAGRSDGGPGLH
jgi:hypothetical protein